METCWKQSVCLQEFGNWEGGEYFQKDAEGNPASEKVFFFFLDVGDVYFRQIFFKRTLLVYLFPTGL